MSKNAESKSPSSVMIEARGLSKFYGPFAAARDVTFSVPKGEVTAFLGPNGAGKSTTMKLLTGFLTPSEGEARIGGFDVSTNRLDAVKLIGYLPENGPLYHEMTPKSLLEHLGHARGMSGSYLQGRLEYVSDKCALHAVWSKTIGKLSRGYKQRVGMAQALLHDPEVLILDEPTSGLDPNQVHEVRSLIHSLAKNKTILLSTHILREVQVCCNRVVLISAGRIVFDGSVADMEGPGKDMEARFRELTKARLT